MINSTCTKSVPIIWAILVSHAIFCLIEITFLSDFFTLETLLLTDRFSVFFSIVLKTFLIAALIFSAGNYSGPNFFYSKRSNGDLFVISVTSVGRQMTHALRRFWTNLPKRQRQRENIEFFCLFVVLSERKVGVNVSEQYFVITAVFSKRFLIFILIFFPPKLLFSDILTSRSKFDAFLNT